MSTLFSACAAYLLPGGDPRAVMLLTWMSGSTYRATLAAVWPGALLLAAGLAAAMAARRWLVILSLDEPAARSLGLRVSWARLYFLAVIAVMTAGATIMVGPLTFVGLLAPHLVRGLGFRLPGMQLSGSALAGAFSGFALAAGSGSLGFTGEGRDWRPRRCALPITALRETPPSSSAIWLAVAPPSHILVSVAMRSSVQFIRSRYLRSVPGALASRDHCR